MRIKDWPKNDRPREKLLQKGSNALTDSELLAIFIRTGNRDYNALDLAKNILVNFGSLKKIMQASPQTLNKIPGIGLAKIAALQAAIELGKRYLSSDFILGEKIPSIQICKQFLQTKLQDKLNEVFSCLFLDHHHRLIAYEEIFQGTINVAQVYPREIVRRSLFHNAAKIIVAHNHPSGVAQPSSADKTVTYALQQILSIVDIQLLDHIIIAHQTNFSFAEEGFI